MDPVLEFNKKEAAAKKVPPIRVGDTVKVSQKIKEGEKERVQVFEGVVIKTQHGYGPNGTFTVRKIASGVGVEKIFPYLMPSIVKIEIVKSGMVRRSKLYYLRHKQQKAARLKERKMLVVEKKVPETPPQKEVKKESKDDKKTPSKADPKEEELNKKETKEVKK